MTTDELAGLIDPVLADLGATREIGEEYRAPPLEVFAYHRRGVRLHWTPLLGRSQSVVAVARQPVDLAGTEAGHRALVARLADAASIRFPPSRALGFGPIGLSAVILTPEPITPEDEDRLAAGLRATLRSRVVPLALIRLNLGQEAMAFRLAEGPANLYREPTALADALTGRFRRFVPTFEWD